ncbi:intracellular protease/amidase [Legionella busanensis]|uniref:Intracellular protease/amidase n=1 Tax=Legionella busanensis TaxID=190655 RepID=A0A378JMD6_9GAMM|nr:type 1 glutamine amidotransferase domain-containing protein [Legionella busanensis]STX51463.1 intracellular protease/amidase [Legionella busanensis]
MEHRIAIVVTNTPEYEKVGYRTGLWLGELVHFWNVLHKAGIKMDIASPLGGFVPLDPESLMLTQAGLTLGLKGTVHRYYKNRDFMNLLGHSLKISDLSPANYSALYLTGGHGVCFDFPKSKHLADLISQLYTANKIIAAVCHGPAGLLEAKLSNGQYLVAGKKVTSFSWQEEKWAKREQAVPFNLEEELIKRGAQYSKAPIPFKKHIVEDGLLITGQNPASAKAVGEAVLKKLT